MNKPTKKDIARWDKVHKIAEQIEDLLHDARNIEDYEQAEILGIVFGRLLHGTINTEGVEDANYLLERFLHELHGTVDVRIDDDLPVIFNLQASIQEDTGE